MSCFLFLVILIVSTLLPLDVLSVIIIVTLCIWHHKRKKELPRNKRSQQCKQENIEMPVTTPENNSVTVAPSMVLPPELDYSQ